MKKFGKVFATMMALAMMGGAAYAAEATLTLDEAKAAIATAAGVETWRNDELNAKVTEIITGHNIYYVFPLTLSNGERGVVGGAYDGTIVAYTSDGKLMWESRPSIFFPSELIAADLNNDGFDETIITYYDGSIHVLDKNGKEFWTYQAEGALYAAAVVEDAGKSYVMAGGIDHYLYKFDGETGAVADTLYIDHSVVAEPKETHSGYAISQIKAGDMYGDGKDYVVIPYKWHDKYNYDCMMVDPATMTVVWDTKINKTAFKNLPKGLLNGEMDVADVDGDGDAEIMFAPAAGDSGGIGILDHNGKVVYDIGRPEELPNRGYRMGNISFVAGEGIEEPFIVNMSASFLVEYDPPNAGDTADTKYERTGIHGKLEYISFLWGEFDSETGLYYLAGDTSGGDVIRVIDMKDDDWGDIFASITHEGNISEVIDNIKTLEQQIANFEMPSYQTPTESKIYISTTDDTYRSSEEDVMQYSAYATWSQIRDWREAELAPEWAAKEDDRKTYNMTVEEMVAQAAAHNAAGQSFGMWVGHGTDPFYIAPSTYKAILDAAPDVHVTFIYSELGGTSEEMRYVIDNLFKEAAKYCQEHGDATMLFRNKNMFWTSNAHTPEWQELLNGDYKDVIIPAMEETNSRAAEVSLPSRVGLWLSDGVGSWGGRMIEDTSDYNKQQMWSYQQVESHFLRAFAYQIAYGAKEFQNVNPTPIPETNTHYDKLVRELINAGVLIPGEKDNLLSITDFALAMREPESAFFESTLGGHDGGGFDPNETTPYVFERLAAYWGGSPTLEHDFSNYGYGVDRRMSSFLPGNPYGLVPIFSNTYDISKDPMFTKTVETDGKFFYDESGAAFTPIEYKDEVEKMLAESAAKLPVIVSSEENTVAWVATKVDDTHIRVSLFDGGYIVPKERTATVTVQNNTALNATNILTGETYAGNSFEVTVPAGTFAFVDIEIK